MRENKRKFDRDLSWSIYETEANETLTYGSIMVNGFFSLFEAAIRTDELTNYIKTRNHFIYSAIDSAETFEWKLIHF